MTCPSPVIEVRSRYLSFKDGYVRLRLSNGTLVREHRFVMAQAMGRELEKWEIVRHLDGNRHNNDISNLMLEERGEPNGHARTQRTVFPTCCVCGEPFPRLLSEMQRARRKGRNEDFCSRRCVGKRFGRGAKCPRED